MRPLMRATSPAAEPLRQRAAAVARARPLRPARRLALAALRRTYTTPRPVLTTREELPWLFNRRGLTGCGVEVGVKRGEFSERLLTTWQGRHLVSVDPWREAPSDEYVDVANVAQAQHERFLAETRERLRPFGARSTIWRTTGEDAAQRVLRHSLDFVYLDARHDYGSVREDLGQWCDRIRPGGVLAGHDYVDGDLPEGRFGVRSAVDDFFGEQGIRVHATSIDPPWISWFALMPR